MDTLHHKVELIPTKHVNHNGKDTIQFSPLGQVARNISKSSTENTLKAEVENETHSDQWNHLSFEKNSFNPEFQNHVPKYNIPTHNPEQKYSLLDWDDKYNKPYYKQDYSDYAYKYKIEDINYRFNNSKDEFQDRYEKEPNSNDDIYKYTTYKYKEYEGHTKSYKTSHYNDEIDNDYLNYEDTYKKPYSPEKFDALDNSHDSIETPSKEVKHVFNINKIKGPIRHKYRQPGHRNKIESVHRTAHEDNKPVAHKCQDDVLHPTSHKPKKNKSHKKKQHQFSHPKDPSHSPQGDRNPDAHPCMHHYSHHNSPHALSNPGLTYLSGHQSEFGASSSFATTKLHRTKLFQFKYSPKNIIMSASEPMLMNYRGITDVNHSAENIGSTTPTFEPGVDRTATCDTTAEPLCAIATSTVSDTETSVKPDHVKTLIEKPINSSTVVFNSSINGK